MHGSAPRLIDAYKYKYPPNFAGEFTSIRKATTSKNSLATCPSTYLHSNTTPLRVDESRAALLSDFSVACDFNLQLYNWI